MNESSIGGVRIMFSSSSPTLEYHGYPGCCHLTFLDGRWHSWDLPCAENGEKHLSSLAEWEVSSGHGKPFLSNGLECKPHAASQTEISFDTFPTLPEFPIT